MDALAEDKDRKYHFVLCCPTGLGREQVYCKFGGSYDRVPHPDDQVEASIERTWRARVARQPSLFNGTKFRFSGCEILEADGSRPSKVCLRLGLTDYRSYIGTNMSERWQDFVVDEENDDDVALCRHLACPLGNSAIVETTDHRVLVLQRGLDVGEFPDSPGFPGGHPEPEEAGIKGHLPPGVAISPQVREALQVELFDGVVREVEEETGIPLKHLSAPRFLGVSRRCFNLRDIMIFYIRCSLSFSEVLKCYANASDRDESMNLRGLTKDELWVEATKMAGCDEGGAQLYRLMLGGQPDGRSAA